jgi:hypothetical protein
MYTRPDVARQLARERHRDMRVHVGQHRLARQLRDLARASRRAEGTQHRQRGTWRPTLRLRGRAHA